MTKEQSLYGQGSSKMTSSLKSASKDVYIINWILVYHNLNPLQFEDIYYLLTLKENPL